MKMTNALTAVLLVGMLLGSSFLATENVRAWDASVSVTPSSVIEGDSVTFEVTVTNTGSEAMKITSIYLGFDWMTDANQFYSSREVPQVLPVGESYTFTFEVEIPEGIDTENMHQVGVEIEAAGPGIIDEWGFSYTNEYYADLSVEPASSPGFSAISAIGVIGIVSLIAVMRKRKTI